MKKNYIKKNYIKKVLIRIAIIIASGLLGYVAGCTIKYI